MAGVEHVALGSDFDGATVTPFDASGVVLVTEALLAEGFAASGRFRAGVRGTRELRARGRKA